MGRRGAALVTRHLGSGFDSIKTGRTLDPRSQFIESGNGGLDLLLVAHSNPKTAYTFCEWALGVTALFGKNQPCRQTAGIG